MALCESPLSSKRTWNELPTDLLYQITSLLDRNSLQAARLACKTWCQGLSMGVTSLKPRMEANAVGLQWYELDKLQVAFPMIKEIDLRQMPPQGCHAHHFAPVQSLRRLYISSLQRSADPTTLLTELREFADGLAECSPAVVIDLELRFGDTSLLWGRSDEEIKAMSSLPSNIQVSMLHMPQLCYAISMAGLHSVMKLTCLRHLRLVTYGGRITDREFTLLAGLTQLEHLWFGVIPYVTDKGLEAGLSKLTGLKELFLYDISNITDAGIEALVPHLSSLEGLSLSKCHNLTNKGLNSLARLPCLTRLFLSENEHISTAAANQMPKRLTCLTVRQCPGVNRSDVYV